MAKPKSRKESAKDAIPTVTVERLVADSGVTMETLSETPTRTITLMQAAASNRAIRRKLAAVGLNAKEQRKAVDLLDALLVVPDSDVQEVENDVVRDSMNFVDDNDEEVHRVLRATLQFNYPDQYKYLTDGLSPSTGMRAVLGMKTLCERYGTMVSGENREDTRKQDREALDLLTVRGVPASRMEELAKHVKRVVELQGDDAPMETDDSDVERVRALIELRKWYLEWSEMARVVIKRRDHLISLGLASRREPGKDGSEPPLDLDPTV